MGIIEVFFIAIGLAMDAFAVSVCKGLSIKKLKISTMVICGLWFGGFQALMPALGYLLGSYFAQYIEQFDHWIAFVLLLIIGIKMICNAFSKADDENTPSLAFRVMLVLAIATSIDAMAVGVTFAFLQVDIVLALIIIGIVSFILSSLGVVIGFFLGNRYQSIAEFFGGAVLIILGMKILIEHLFL